MKTIKILITMSMLSLLIFLTGCSYFIPISYVEPSQGTYSGEFYDYEEFAALPTYTSSSYNLTDINDYNTLLLNTKEHIVKANIQVETKIDLGLSYDTKSGSGFIFKEDDTYYYAITNNHVIESDGRHQATYQIMTYEDTEYQDATVLISSSDLDLAVMRFTKNNRQEVEMINMTQRLGYRLKNDELVIAVGNPLDLTNSVSFGSFQGITLIENVDFIVLEHTADIYNGSSGGALVDIEGNLLGVNTWGLDEGNLSFSIPNFIVYNFLTSNDII